MSSRFRGRSQADLDRFLNIRDGFFGRLAVRRAILQVWHVGDPKTVLVWPEDIDMIMRLIHERRLAATRLTPFSTSKITNGDAIIIKPMPMFAPPAKPVRESRQTCQT